MGGRTTHLANATLHRIGVDRIVPHHCHLHVTVTWCSCTHADTVGPSTANTTVAEQRHEQLTASDTTVTELTFEESIAKTSTKSDKVRLS